jgi:beta-xylosidase
MARRALPLPPAAVLVGALALAVVWSAVVWSAVAVAVAVAAGAATAHHRAPSYRNPVVAGDAPDPDVVVAGGTYYAFTTGGPGGPIQLFFSHDLARWQSAGWPGPLVHDAAWSVFGREWAPGVAEVGDRWVLYYATEQAATGDQCITAATSLTIGGPYVNDSSGPLACGAIDPSPLLTTGGAGYLVWRGTGPDGTAEILSEALAPGGLAFAPGSSPAVLVGQSEAWESTVENPDLVRIGGQYLLFYSGGRYTDATYATGYARCAGPLGPCTKPLGHPWLATTAQVVGPGGASAFQDTAGRWWLAYAAMAPDAGAHEVFGQKVRSMRIDPICMVGGAPVLLGPSTAPRPLRPDCPGG